MIDSLLDEIFTAGDCIVDRWGEKEDGIEEVWAMEGMADDEMSDLWS